jgi:hypothetical protein
MILSSAFYAELFYCAYFFGLRVAGRKGIFILPVIMHLFIQEPGNDALGLG